MKCNKFGEENNLKGIVLIYTLNFIIYLTIYIILLNHTISIHTILYLFN